MGRWGDGEMGREGDGARERQGRQRGFLKLLPSELLPSELLNF
jgi:hypothetical protein